MSEDVSAFAELSVAIEEVKALPDIKAGLPEKLKAKADSAIR
jgi:hypothetical protein